MKRIAVVAAFVVSACSASPEEQAAQHKRELQAQAEQRVVEVREQRKAQTKAEADSAWNSVEAAKTDYPEGRSYHVFNRNLTAAYQRWEALQLAAYGSGWQKIWHDSHRGDSSDCSANQELGMPMSACLQAASDEGNIPPLEPMLMKCQPDGVVIPTDAESCRSHGKRTITDTPEGRAAVEATWETPEAQQMMADAHALDAQHEQQRQKRRDKALRRLGLE